MKVVADTNIIVSGLLWAGKPFLILEAARHERIRLFTSAPLIKELHDVLSRRKFEQFLQRANITPGILVNKYSQLADIVVTEPFPVPIIIADPDNDNVLSCAIVAFADVIVSGDHHLLELKKFMGIPILTANQLVEHLP